jgi:hypothetical protein
MKTFLMRWVEPHHYQTMTILCFGESKGSCFGKILEKYDKTDPDNWTVLEINQNDNHFYNIEDMEINYYSDEDLINSFLKKGWRKSTDLPEELYLEVIVKRKNYWGVAPGDFTINFVHGYFEDGIFYNILNNKTIDFLVWKPCQLN